ncbi:MAG: DNA translocase FtsK 4TM domain-containing protein, partial [Acidobacteriota bacterium]
MLPRTHTDADAPSAHPNADGQRALFPMRPEKGHEILVVALFFLAVLLTASLLTYHPLDPSLLHDAPDGAPEPRNLIGHAGAQLAAVAFALLGIVALLLPLPLAFALWQRVRHRTGLFDRLRLFGMAAIALSLPALVQLSISDFGWRGETLQPGGVLGVLIADGLSALLNEIGARVVLLMCLFVGGSLAVRATFSELFADARGLLQRVTDRTWRWRVQRQRRRQPDDAAVDDVPTDDATTAHAAAMRDDAPAIDDAFDAVLRRAEPASAEGDDATQRRWLRPRLRPVVVTAPAPAGLDRRRSSSRRELFTRRKGVVDGPLRVRQRFAYDADTRSYDVDATPRVLARGTAAATAYPVADPAD